MKINEAEELLGISKANIRFYEKEGLLTPRRGENRYRDYSEEDLDRLREIVILRKLGISVQDIKQSKPAQNIRLCGLFSFPADCDRKNGAVALY